MYIKKYLNFINESNTINSSDTTPLAEQYLNIKGIPSNNPDFESIKNISKKDLKFVFVLTRLYFETKRKGILDLADIDIYFNVLKNYENDLYLLPINYNYYVNDEVFEKDIQDYVIDKTSKKPDITSQDTINDGYHILDILNIPSNDKQFTDIVFLAQSNPQFVFILTKLFYTHDPNILLVKYNDIVDLYQELEKYKNELYLLPKDYNNYDNIPELQTDIFNYIIHKTKQINVNAEEEQINQNVDIPTNKPLTEKEVDKFLEVVSSGDLIKVKELIGQNKELVNCKTIYGITPLMISAIDSYNDIGLYLIEQGANINAKDKKGTNAFMYAAYSNSIILLKKFIELKVNVNDVDENGNTALMKAVLKSNSLAIKILLEAGADPNIRNKRGFNVFDYVYSHVKDGNDRILIMKKFKAQENRIIKNFDLFKLYEHNRN